MRNHRHLPRCIRDQYKGRTLTRSSSLDTAPVTGSLLFNGPVCRLAVYCATGFSTCVLLGSSDSIWLADGDATAGAQSGITFGVMLDVPWNAPEAIVHLHSVGVVDLNTVPDVLGLTGWRPEAAVVRVLQGRVERSVRALIPDPRVLERGFHNVTIVDMEDLPEPSVSQDELSLLRLQWPVTVIRNMVWLQNELDAMCAAAKKQFRNSRPGDCSYCGICTAMYLHIIWIWASGVVPSVVVYCVEGHATGLYGPCPGGRAMYRQITGRLAWRSFSHHGLSVARFGWALSNPAIRGFLRMSCCSAKYNFHWCIIIECSGGGCPIMHSAGTTSPVCGCLCCKQRPWCNVICRLRFRAARFHRMMLAPVMWSLSLPGRHDVSDAGCGRLVFVTNPSVSCLGP